MQKVKNFFSSLLSHLFLAGLCVLFIISSCKKDEKDDDSVKEEVSTEISSEDSIFYVTNEVMQTYYLWNDQLPTDLDIYSYENPNDLMEAMRYDQYDHWSTVLDASYFESVLETGASYSIGFRLRWNSDNTLRVVNVYKGSQAEARGMRKGNVILSINGTESLYLQDSDYDAILGSRPGTYHIIFSNSANVTQSIDLVKSEINLNAVFCAQIDTIADKKVGYLVYDGFTEYSESELDEAFTYFQTNNIEELVVDLRYNGGGYIYLAMKLCNMIAPATAVGHEMFSYSWNDIVAPEMDTTINFEANPLNLNLSRVFFITSQFTASASELTINSLEPYMDVQVIGSRSHGKPVGMPTIPFQHYYILPVSFRTTNANGYGDYFDGLAVDQTANEGLAYNWGDPLEPNLAQALYYIEHDSYNYSKSSSFHQKSTQNLTSLAPYKNTFMLIK